MMPTHKSFKVRILDLDMANKGNMPWNKGKHLSEEMRKKLSEAHKGQIPWIKGKHHSEESIRKMSESHKGQDHWTGRRHTEESRRKMSESAKIAVNPNRFKKGNIISEEIRRKISEAHKGKPAWNKGKKMDKSSPMKGKHHTEEAKMKNRLSHLGKSAWNKGKKMSLTHPGLIPWNKGKQGTFRHSEEAKRKIRESRAKQIFPIKDSLLEIKIQNFLKQLNIEFILHKNIKEIKHNYQCDIFIPSMNLVIECDGDYWHGNINNPRFKILNKSQINTKERDNIRTKELIEKGFRVLRLWESDIEKMNFKDFIERIKSF